MNQKFVVKHIKFGQASKVNVVAGGAGASGNALVLTAQANDRYQISDVVTLISPQKLQIKRRDADLHLALPGGDIDSPDVVIKGYFNVKGASLWGVSIDGEMLSYSTNSLDSAYTTASPLNDPLSEAGNFPESKSVANEYASAHTVTLGDSAGVFSSPWGWAAAVGLGVAVAKGGGGSSASQPTPDALTTIVNYASNSGATAPTSANYAAAGVTLPIVTGSQDVLNVMNALVASKTAAEVNTADKLNALASSLKTAYEKIIAEANGSSTADVTPSANPSEGDYASVGVSVAKLGKTLDLLNNAIGELDATAVDTIAELKTLAATAGSVMALAAVSVGGAVPVLTQTDADLILGLNALLGGGVMVTVSNLAAVKTSLIATADDGVELAEVAQLKTIVALQVLKDYANATVGAGVTAPSLAIYKYAGVKALASLSESSASLDVDSTTVTSALGVTSASWLTTLNSALDKLDGTTLTKVKIQSMVDSFYRILSEADGVVNSITNVDVYPNTAGDGAGGDNPSSTDYINIGATVGNAKAIDLLNDFVGLSTKTAVDTVDEINAVARAAYNVVYSAGMTTAPNGTAPALYTTDAEWVAGLTALGVNGVSVSNISNVKAAIVATADDGTAVDTVQELKDLLSPVIALQVLKDYANLVNGVGAVTVPTLGGLPLSGTLPTSGTYTDLGIKTYKSLTDTSEANRKYFGDPSTVAGAESNSFLSAGSLNSALDKLDATTLTKTKVQAMVDSYYRILREADGKYVGDSKGGTSYYDGSTIEKTADTDVYNDTVNDNTNATNFNDPTLADYANIGITVADAISATVYNPTTGVGNETLDLLNDAIGRMSAASVDTADEIETLASTANDVMLLAKGSITSATQLDANFIAGFNLLLGLTTTTGVNLTNIASVKAAIVASADTGLEVDTVNELLGLLSMVRLKEFTDDGGALGSKTSATPTLNDWAMAGTGLTANSSLTDDTRIALKQATYWQTTNPSNGLSALNSALDTYAAADVNQVLLQKIVDAYGRVLQEADGSRSTDTDVSKITTPNAASDVQESDLLTLGVYKGGNTNNATTYGTGAGQGAGLYYQKTGELLASAIGSLSSTAVDTVAELNTLGGYAEVVMKQAAATTVAYTDSEWVTALNALLGANIGTGVNSNNIADVKTAIKTAGVAGVDTWDELQAIVSLVRLDDYAAQSTGWTTPTIMDYQSVAKDFASTTVKSAYLSSYNDAVNAQSSISSEASVKDMLAAYTTLLDSADGNRATTTSSLTTTTFDDIWGVVPASSDAASLLNDVISGLTTSSIDQVSELIALANTANKIMSLAGGTAQSITRQELTNLGLNDGAGHSFTDFNSSSGTYWITDAEWGRFTATSGVGSIGAAGGVAKVDTWQELQNLLTTAIISA
jgi:hypothetical protein